MDQDWQLSETENIWLREGVGTCPGDNVNLVALLRIRNESLILEDTLDHISTFADIICAYEDASTDASRNILKAHERVKLIIENDVWQPDIQDRLLAETRHRGLLLQEAKRHFQFHWCLGVMPTSDMLAPYGSLSANRWRKLLTPLESNCLMHI